MKIDSSTDLYCIFGKPVRHSLSPVIHNALFNHYHINSVYLAFEPENIQNGLDSVRSLGIKGASITIPFKIDVIKYIDEISPLAEKIGSVNTLINTNGKITGHNTDGFGVLKPLIDLEIDLNLKKILIIGNGGSARSTAFTMIENGAFVFISGRSDEKIKQLEHDLSKTKNNAGSINLNLLDKQFMKDIDIIINTTPVGMEPEDNLMPLKPEYINEKHIVFDIIYKPDKTKLLKTAESRGCKIIKGINMLIFQAMMQFEIWTGVKPDPGIVYSALNLSRQ
jgi:shikimate dehydrogenase